MARLTVHTVETAPEAAKPRVEAALKNNGFIPNLIGVLANAPEALAFYQEVGKLNAANSLTPGEVEVIQIIAARTNECGFCVAGHTKLATLKKLLSEQSIKASRALAAGEFDDAKLGALAAFTQAVMAKKGAVSDAELQAFLDAGYNKQQSVEVVMGVALANMRLDSLRDIHPFKENVTVLLISGVFVLLSATLNLTVLERFEWPFLAFLLALLFLVRPATVLLSLHRVTR